MPRIFLVDDEQPVLDGLSVVIAKNLPDMEICGMARSGREAIDGALAARPDLLLLDVRMPGIDGLEALREIRSRLPDVVTILLSAYERFDIAKKAFELGVFDYLVKPANQERIVSTIRAAADEVAKRRAAHREAYSAKEALERARPFIAESLVLSALFGDRSAPGGEDRSEALRILGVEGDECLVAVFEPRGEPHGPVASAMLRDRLSAELAYGIECVVGPLLAGRVPVVVPLQGTIEEAAEGARSTIRQFLAKDTLPRAAAGISAVRPYAELCDAIVEARVALGAASEPGSIACRGSGAEQAAALSQASPNRASASLAPATRALELIDAAAAGDSDRAAFALDAWFDEEASAGEPEGVIRERCRSLLAISLWFAGDGLFVENLAGSAGALREEARFLLASRMSQARSGPRGRRGRQVDDALRYIESGFTRQISLEETAEAVGVSPAHLSRMFMEVVGVSFIDYLTKLRIERAKELLRKGETSVKVIALSSGYTDPNYFSRIFKKSVGATPSEYLAALGRNR